MIPAYQPQLDSQTEALNKFLEMYLRCFASNTPSTWFALLLCAKFWYNTSYKHSSKLTPFEVVYDHSPLAISRFIWDSSTNIDVSASFLQRDKVLAVLKAKLFHAQEYMKINVVKNCRDVVLNVGDWVYVCILPYRQLS